MHPLFRVGEGGSTPTSALSLTFMTVGVETVIELNRAWHSRLPKLSRNNLLASEHRAFYAAEFDGLFYAVAAWTHPIARLLPSDTCMELRRLAIADDAPKYTASRMLGWMVRDIWKRFPVVDRLVSYQDCEVHKGTIYLAAGWTPFPCDGGGQWGNPSRARYGVRIAMKKRWEKSRRGAE